MRYEATVRYEGKSVTFKVTNQILHGFHVIIILHIIILFSFLPEDSPTITAGVASTCCFFFCHLSITANFISMPFQHQNNDFLPPLKMPLSPYIPTAKTCFSI